ncbi:hypothetical protein ABPG77_003973 [Micractinium sp. CCAP 211/92]
MAQQTSPPEQELRDLPLPALFQRARGLLKQLDTTPASDPSKQRLVADGAACLRAAAAAADALALFSANEDRDDLATGDIKYLLIPFYQAEVASHTHADDPSVRLAALEAAGQHYRAFLQRCRQYDLLSPPAAALAAGVLEHGDGGGGSSGGGRGRPDPAALRQSKIEKFKREKAIRARIQELEQQQQRLVAAPGGGDGEAECGAGFAGFGGAGAGTAGDGEEVERELWLLQADLAALQAAERCGTLQQEVEILRHAAAMPADERQRQREQRAAEGPPADLMRQLGAVAAANRRQQLAGGVFRPSHALPAMSVEQFGELEYKRMLEQQEREARAKERAARQQAERSAEDVEEEELQKARAWDDFKDDNPRGWGNSKLRPCS